MDEKNEQSLSAKSFQDWFVEKERIHNKHLDYANNVYYREGEIYWVSLGKNIGFEEDGKGRLFTRPVLIVRGISRTLFFGVPLTSKPKVGDFYFSFKFHGNISYGMISQMRSFDSSRIFSNRYGKINRKTLETIKERIRNLF